MKKTLLVTIMACAISAPAAQAVDIYDYDEPYPPMSVSQAGSFGVGAVVGGLLGGPIGVLLGGAGGGLLDNTLEHNEDIATLQQELSTAQQQLADLQQQNRLLAQRKVSARQTSTSSAVKLDDALSRGFSFSVQFRNNNDTLESQYNQQLHDVSKAFAGMNALHVYLSGHADRNGSSPYNQSLSEKRVQAVAVAIRRAGWPAERLHVTAHGESRPLSKPGDSAGYPFDRRVTISFSAEGAGI